MCLWRLSVSPVLTATFARNRHSLNNFMIRTIDSLLLVILILFWLAAFCYAVMLTFVSLPGSHTICRCWIKHSDRGPRSPDARSPLSMGRRWDWESWTLWLYQAPHSACVRCCRSISRSFLIGKFLLSFWNRSHVYWPSWCTCLFCFGPVICDSAEGIFEGSYIGKSWIMYPTCVS